MLTPDNGHLSAGRVLDLIAEPVLIVSRDGRIVAQNAGASIEFRDVPLIGTRLHDYTAETEAVDCFLRDCASSSSTVPGTFTCVIGDRVAEWKTRGGLVAPPTNGTSARIAVRLVRHDEAWARFRSLTAEVRQLRELSRMRHNELIEQRKRESQLLQSQKLESIGLLASGISHDFNNLLTAIRGYTEIARTRAKDAPDVLRYLQFIEAGTDRAASLTGQLLAYSGKGKFVVEPVNLSDEISACADLLRVSISGSTELVLELDAALPNCRMDRVQLQQVLMNLVINASEAIEAPHGTVTISTFSAELEQRHFDVLSFNGDMQPGRFACLEISDTGTGMDEATVERVFDPFFSTKDAGHGLGLAAVLGIIKSHRGGIAIDTAPGRGTTIRILLPATDEVAGIDRDAGDDIDVERSGTILVIDDEPSVLQIACELVELIGMRAVAAASGEEGVALFAKDPSAIDIVLLDINMPGMDGIETMQELIDIDPDVRVVLSSGYSEETAIDGRGERRATAFLQKPYSLRSLSRTIANAIAP
jgi:signal transduction histidine kinase